MQADPRGDRLRPHPWKGVLAGALGGLVASIAMSKFYLLLPRAGSDSQTGEEDSTVKVASAISQAIFHHELTSDQKTMAASAVHYAFGITMATLFGLLAEFRESTRLGWGLPFGAAIWLGAHVITVPTLGLSEPVTCAAPAAEGYELTAHLVYGAVVEGIRRALRAHPLRQAYRCER